MTTSADRSQLGNAEFYLDPDRHRVFAELRKNEPVSRHSLPNGEAFWAVVRHADIVSVCSDPDSYSSSQGAFLEDVDVSIGSMITTDPPRHTDMRQAVAEFFKGRALRSLEDWLRTECRRLVEQAIEAKEVEFVYDIAADLPLNVIGKLMELSKAERDEMLRLCDALVKAARVSLEKAAAAGMEMAAFSIAQANARRGKGGDDLISSMLTIGGEDHADADFANMFLQIAVAGTETTRSTLGRIVTVLAQDPALMRRLAEPDCDLDAALNELLRYYVPVNHTRRTATRDHELHGASIKAGDKIGLMIASANFDETVFDSPHEFDITRHPNPHLSFGVGHHHCLGFRMAKMELRIFLEEFLRSVAEVELTAEPLIVPTLIGTFVEGANVRVVPR